MQNRRFQFSYRIVYLDANFRYYLTYTSEEPVIVSTDPDILPAELTALARFPRRIGKICRGPALALGTPHRWCRLVSLTCNPLLDAGQVGAGHLLSGAAFTPIRDQSVNARLREASLRWESSWNECLDSQFQPLLVALILRGAGTTVRVYRSIVSLACNPLLNAGQVGAGHLLGCAAVTPIRDQSVNACLREASLRGESSRDECHDSQFQPLLVALILRDAGTTVRVPNDITFPNTRNGDALSMSNAFISISRTVTAADLCKRENDNDNTHNKKCKNSKSTSRKFPCGSSIPILSYVPDRISRCKLQVLSHTRP